ncbi:CBS domain-containing protein [Streptosporangiaceae bacterium NEAU-GS5]|nr:CBS domain-containing protein [Streptosporangiaceae bacterium NEAU-GS5]
MRITVADVMTTDIIAVRGEASFHTVAQPLIDRNVSGMPVVDADGVVAVANHITWRDNDIPPAGSWGGA